MRRAVCVGPVGDVAVHPERIRQVAIYGGGQAGAGEAGVCLTGAVLDQSDPLHGGSGKEREV